MPPSPSLRRSPGSDPRDSHKRGRSLESGLSFKDAFTKEKEDDLALFNEMQSRETDNFLLQPTDDLEDIFSSRVKPFPDFKLGINIPARGESSSLLNLEGDKNDYEWLLTPPETPLFRSLDDEPAPVNLVHNGRDRSRPISISRSSTIDRSQRSSRGSQSPQHLSLSPRSGSSTFRGRPSSAPNASPIPLRPSTSRRPSPSPVKPSTPPPRSLTPTSRRTSVGSGGSGVTSGVRGTSPVRTNRGNSASPKIRAWQSNIPGFSLEAPPNLRTSLADRPASYVRGSSPASRSSRDSSNPRRQSMSPTPSRSISSSHSQERDRLSSHSKGSVASSGDDDADSLLSTPMSVSDRSISRRGVGGFSNGRPGALSKKSAKTFSPSSAPKRSFDSAMRQMDRKSPQNMFRPLLSSVPSSTFYAGNVSVAQRSMISRNSSVTTSSNASSDQATSGAHDTEGSDLYQDDMASDSVREPFLDTQDELFAFDKMDVAIKGGGFVVCDPSSGVQLGETNESIAFASNAGDSKGSKLHVSETVDEDGNYVELDSQEITLLCSICGCSYPPDELIESEEYICPECRQKEEMSINPALLIRLETTQNTLDPLMDTTEELNVKENILSMPQPQITEGDTHTKNISEIASHEEASLEAEDQNDLHKQSCSESVPMLSEQQETAENRTVHNTSRANIGLLEMNKSADRSDRSSEGAGISVLLLKRSGSGKGPLISSRNINSSAISFDDLSYPRDLTSSMRSSTGHGSMSTSSSIDLTSTRHGEMFVQRQLSGKRSDTSSKAQSTVSSYSGISMQVYQGLGASTSSHEENCEESVSNVRHNVVPGLSPDQVSVPETTELHDSIPSLARTALSEEANGDIHESLVEKHALVVATEDNELDDSRGSLHVDEAHVLHRTDEDLQKNIGDARNIDSSTFPESSATEESTVADNRDNQMEVAVDPHQGSLSTMSEIEIDDSHPCSPRSQSGTISKGDLEDSSLMTCTDKDGKLSDSADGIVEESTVTMEDQGGRTRSLTLEEATDTILFCSSIIHDLAYKAANIAIEKEKENLEPLEGSRPTVTIPEKHSSYRRNPTGNTPGRATKTPKARKKRAETEAKPPLAENEERSGSGEAVVRNVGLPNNDDSMKPPKLESKCNCTIM